MSIGAGLRENIGRSILIGEHDILSTGETTTLCETMVIDSHWVLLMSGMSIRISVDGLNQSCTIHFRGLALQVLDIAYSICNLLTFIRKYI